MDTEIQFIKGVGPKLAEKLHKLGIYTVNDLIFHWPRTHLDYTNISPISHISPIGQIVVICGHIIGIDNKYTSKRHMKVTEAVVEDGTGTLKMVWFNQPFLKDVLYAGSEWIFRGKVSYDRFNQIWVMESPSRVKEPCIVPVYPTTSGLSANYIYKLISNQESRIKNLEDFLPQDIIENNKLLPLADAVIKIHTPQDWPDVNAAKKRLAFDELFLLSLRSRLAKEDNEHLRAPKIVLAKKELDNFLKSLPFELTSDQKKASDQIIHDLAAGKPMNRLLNGDVGSGKTVVAVIAAVATARAGYKTVLMVPTEVLASQHYETFCKLLAKQKIPVGLLTSSMKKTNKAVNMANRSYKSNETNLNDGLPPQEADIVIGTQALLQKNVNLANVGLVITDEQHRFGVNQRAALRRFNGLENVPHFLSMTATPIPRTLHLALFGDLDVCVIKEKPKNRKEIKTRFVEPKNRAKAYEFIAAQIKVGRQIFVICPLIEDPENAAETLFDEDKKSVVKEYEKLSKEIFPHFKVAMLHGKMKPKEKENILQDFNMKKYDILVSTSVIEVGIDIPNASVMMIEDAERFGLAQIHQFRGRVGRGEHQSFCFLFSGSRNPKSLERLSQLERISDGFELAEADLETRGPGDVLGTMQSGQMELKLASFSDRILLEEAATSAKSIIDSDPKLSKYPKLLERLAQFETQKHFE